MKPSILGVVAALPLAAHAAPSSIKPVVEPVGIKLSSSVAEQAYCNGSHRAIALLRDGSVVAIDSSGTTTLGNVGRIGVRYTVTCNGNDHVLVTRGAELATIDRSGMTTATL